MSQSIVRLDPILNDGYAFRYPLSFKGFNEFLPDIHQIDLRQVVGKFADVRALEITEEPKQVSNERWQVKIFLGKVKERFHRSTFKAFLNLLRRYQENKVG